MTAYVPPVWTLDALCTQIGGDLWFPPRGGDQSQAKRVCAECPVAAQCLQYAIDINVEHGIWAGLPASKIRKLGKTA